MSKESDKLGSSGDKAGWKATQEAAQMPERKIGGGLASPQNAKYGLGSMP